MTGNMAVTAISFTATIALILVLIYAYRRYREFRFNLSQKLFEIISSIRAFYKETRTLRAKGKTYTNYKEDPYVEPIQHFSAALRQTAENLSFLGNERLRLINTISKDSPHFPKIPIISFLYIHHKWIKLKKEIDKLDYVLSEQNQEISLTKSAIEYLQNLPWKTALRARKIKSQNDLSKSFIEGLYKAGVQGQTIEHARSRGGNIESKLKNIPDSIYHNSEKEIVTISDSVHLTIFVHNILEAVNLQCTQLNDDLKHWDKVYSDGMHAIEKATKTIANTINILKTVPPQLNIDEERNTLRELTARLQSLYAERKSPTIEMLEPFVGTANDLSTKSYSLGNKLNEAKEDFKKFELEVATFDTKIKQLQRDMYHQSSRAIYPIEWTLTKATLEKLFNKKGNLALMDELRTIEELAVDIKEIEQLTVQLNTIEKVVGDKISNAHELRKHWDLIKQLITDNWRTLTNQLVNEISQYAPENWDDKNNIFSLQQDGNSLYERATEILPLDTFYKISEDEVSEMVLETSNIINSIHEFEQRRSLISNRLLEVRRAELITQKIIDDNLPVAQTIAKGTGIETLPLLSANEMIELAIKGEEIQAEIKQPRIGDVFNKSERAQQWSFDLLNKGETLIADLQRITEEKQNTLQEKIEEIQNYGKKIQDPIIQTAMGYAPMNVYAFEIDIFNNEMTIETIYQQLHSLTEEYKRVDDCETGFEMKIAPLRDEYYKVLELKEQANAKLKLASQQLNRSWPPTTDETDISREVSSFQRIGGLFDEIRSHKRDIGTLEREYYEIRSDLNYISEEVERKIRLDNKEMERFNALKRNAETRLDTLVESSLKGYDKETASVYRQILKQKGDAFFRNIEAEYRAGSLTSYDVHLALNDLFRERNTKIDIHNQVIKMGDIHIENGTMSLNQAQ